MEEFDVVIVGAGAAGLTAALYAARACRKTIVFERKLTGGQIATTDLVENFPGFPNGINGFDLGQLFVKQAERFGAVLAFEDVSALQRDEDGCFTITTSERQVRARAVIVAAGAEYNRLGVPGEDEFSGRGVSWCATCDAAFFRNQDVAVVGGGDAALDEGLFVSRYASSVTLIHRRDSLRATKVLQERAFANPKFRFLWDTVVEQIRGADGQVTSLDLRNVRTGETSELAVNGVFIFIGQSPTNQLLRALVELDAGGHAIVDLEMRTSVPGIFVAGDLRARAARQLVAAAGDGATAAISAEHYLDQQGPGGPVAK